MHKIIIIGAGFAGLSAASRLSRGNLDLQVTILDKKDTFDFLPLVPDCIGRKFKAKFLTNDIKYSLPKSNFSFIRKEVSSIDFQTRQVFTSTSSHAYDFLVIASGSQTNFFANQEAQKHAYALNSVKDVLHIVDTFQNNNFDNFVICGGGYTGIEVASNLWLHCRKNRLSNKIFIVERASEILGPLPDWMKSYVCSNLKGMGIEILTNSVVEKVEEHRLVVSGNRVFEKAMLIWVPGVRTADFIQKLEVEKSPQGRIVVDEYLKFKENCFCAGDTALFAKENNPLRMAIQFAITEGNHAADNIARFIIKRPLKKFKPVDLGYIIPMANNKSCGRVFGLNLKGALPTLLHFVMCIYRLNGLRNKIGLIGNLIKEG